MSWLYRQSSGDISHNGEWIATGYSGIGADMNVPGSEAKPFLGPLPRGSYSIGPAIADGGHMGPIVLPLAPSPNNNMLGRAGFYIHGDTPARDHSASNGCIILDRQYRAMISQSGDAMLVVVA